MMSQLITVALLMLSLAAATNKTFMRAEYTSTDCSGSKLVDADAGQQYWPVGTCRAGEGGYGSRKIEVNSSHCWQTHYHATTCTGSTRYVEWLIDAPGGLCNSGKALEDSANSHRYYCMDTPGATKLGTTSQASPVVPCTVLLSLFVKQFIAG